MTRYWTVQHPEVWQRLQRGEAVHGPALDHKDDAMFRDAYAWMMRQMDALPDADAASSGTPVWVWPTRVDLREATFRRWAKDQRMVLLTLEMQSDRVLLSDYDAWHFVLNYWYLGGERASDCFHRWTERVCNTDVYRSKPLPLDRAHRLVERSWERVFELERLRTRLEYGAAPQSVQGTLWRLKPEDVVGVVEYGMGRPKTVLL